MAWFLTILVLFTWPDSISSRLLWIAHLKRSEGGTKAEVLEGTRESQWECSGDAHKHRGMKGLCPSGIRTEFGKTLEVQDNFQEQRRRGQCPAGPVMCVFSVFCQLSSLIIVMRLCQGSSGESGWHQKPWQHSSFYHHNIVAYLLLLLAKWQISLIIAVVIVIRL